MTPDEVIGFLLPHTAEICRTTPALSRYIPGRENHLGSGVLLRVGETPFMLTAAHVADEFRDLKWKGIFFGTPDFELLSVGTVKFLCSKPGKDPFRSDDPIDVAVVELSQEVAAKLSEFMRFLSPEDLLLDPQKLEHGTYLVNGFPDSRVEKDEMDETIVAQNLPYFTHLHDREQPPIPDFSPLNNIALDARNPYQDSEFSFGVDHEYSEGMSGGGIWRLYDEGQPIDSLDWKKAKLVGIFTEGTDPKYKGSIGYFRGTKLRCVVKLFLAGWPHLAPVLAKSIPPRFVNDPA
jgi:hypothetical protein